MSIASFLRLDAVRKHWFSFAVLFFISCFYYAPSSKSLNNVFYIFVLIPFTVSIFFGWKSWKVTLLHYRYYAVFCGTLLIATIVNGATIDQLGYQLTRLYYVTGFIGAIALAFRFNTRLHEQILKVLIYCAPVNAAFTLSWAYVFKGQGFSQRLEGWGVIQNPILLSSIHAIAVFSALYLFFHSKARSRWLYLLCVMPSFAIIFLAQSRGPLLALIIICFGYMVFSLWKSSKFIVLVLSFSLAISLLLAMFLLNNIGSRMASFDGARPAIWGEVIGKITNAPLLGYGLHESSRVTAPVNAVKADGSVREENTLFLHPHNIYLTTSLHGGVLALLAFIVLVSITACSARRINYYHYLLAFGLVYTFFDGGRIFTTPRELWLIIWLPLGILLAAKFVHADKEILAIKRH